MVLARIRTSLWLPPRLMRTRSTSYKINPSGWLLRAKGNYLVPGYCLRKSRKYLILRDFLLYKLGPSRNRSEIECSSCFRLILFGDFVRRLLSFLGLALFVVAVSTPPADAAQRKRQVAKTDKHAVVAKQRVSRTFVAGKRKSVVHVRTVSFQPSFGQLAGLHGVHDTLDLKSSVALVMDQGTGEVLFSKNDNAVLPIASLTKLMTGLVISEAHLPMDQIIRISQEDVDTEKGSSSRLKVGAELSRGELLHLALMSSENRAAHALARSYPVSYTHL